MTRSELKCEKLQTSNGSSWGGSYLLDVESEESITMLENHWLQNLGPRINFQPDRPAGDIVIHKKSEPFVSNGLQTKVDMNGADSDEIFYCAIDADLSLEEQWFKYPAPFRIDGIDQLEDVSSMFSEKDVKDMIPNPMPSTGGTISPASTSVQENDHDSVSEKLNLECLNDNKVDYVGTHKRLRKPTKRYIDEISEPTSKPNKRRGDICNAKIPVKHHKVLALKSKDQKSLPDDDLLGKAIQVPFAPVFHSEKPRPFSTKVNIEPLLVASKVKKGPRRHMASKTKFKGGQSTPSSVRPPPSEQVLNPSSDDRLALVTIPHDESNGPHALHTSSDHRLGLLTIPPHDESNGELIFDENNGRRKHHILWTMSEVKKLIDGVSQHGVGKWSRMKKDLFPSSPHRTPVDLKDKWRNLLKAVYIQREKQRGEGKKRNVAWRPLPNSILQRVSELSIKYPYPRDLRSKR